MLKNFYPAMPHHFTGLTEQLIHEKIDRWVAGCGGRGARNFAGYSIIPWCLCRERYVTDREKLQHKVTIHNRR